MHNSRGGRKPYHGLLATGSGQSSSRVYRLVRGVDEEAAATGEECREPTGTSYAVRWGCGTRAHGAKTRTWQAGLASLATRGCADSGQPRWRIGMSWYRGRQWCRGGMLVLEELGLLKVDRLGARGFAGGERGGSNPSKLTTDQIMGSGWS